MGPVPASSEQLRNDERLTAEREEVKYLVPAGEVKTLAAALGHQLPHHRFTGNGANPLPRPRHFVTTIYFDTPARDQFHAAVADPAHNVKMRGKEYYDLHPSLAELATDPRQIVKYQPVLWLELKQRDGNRTSKRRVGIPKAELPAFFEGGVITPQMIELQRSLHGVESELVLREIAAHCARFSTPMRADCLVNYRRMPWQDEAGGLRVTLDLGLEFFAPPADLWRRDHALVRESLGRAVGQGTDAVLELKSHGPPPAWLEELLVRVGARPGRFSKFEVASAAVHGAGDR